MIFQPNSKPSNTGVLKNELLAVSKTVIQRQNPIAIDKKWYGIMPENRRIVRDVIIGRNYQDDNIGGIFPYFFPQHQKLLGGPIPAYSEIENLDLVVVECITRLSILVNICQKAVLRPDLHS